jgi:hypothetical protein
VGEFISEAMSEDDDDCFVLWPPVLGQEETAENQRGLSDEHADED